LHDRCGEQVRLQPVQASAVDRLSRVRVRAGVGEPVAIGRAAAEETAFHRRLGGHRGSDTDLDAVAFAFAHPAVQRHDQFVSVAARVNGSAHLGHPQLNLVVLEDGEGQAKLVAVERPLRLTDDHALEATSGVL
jgi:hypothetical protein